MNYEEIWISRVGPENLATPARSMLSPRPASRREMSEDMHWKSKWSRDVAEDDSVLGVPDSSGKERHTTKGSLLERSPKKGWIQQDAHGGMEWKQFKEKLSPPHLMSPTNVLAALMMKGPLNSMTLVAVTQRGFGKVADETSTRVMTCTINRWRVRIDWKEVYNGKDPPRMGDREKGRRREKKKKTAAVCMVLKNHGNLVLEVGEEEYQAPRMRHLGTTFQTRTYFLISLSTPNHVLWLWFRPTLSF